VQRRLNHERSSLDELSRLAESAGYNIVGKVEQIRERDPTYQIGRGKVNELAALIKAKEAERVIFDNELSPLQAYNLAKETKVEAIDRFQLILEIFVRRAATTEAKLQIELARLRYELPRARERVRLAKGGEQPGFMGLGAYQVELYYETIKRQIHRIQSKLRDIRKKRNLHRMRRMELGYFAVSLAGYTNAGKSSLFNALAEESARVGEGLFTTLSTTTRAISLSNKKVLLTDTVGFIDRLPLTLIEAFQSTLEETIFSDLILLVLDVSEATEDIENKLTVCLDTIQAVGASGIPVITALNKIDLLQDSELQQKVASLKGLTSNLVPVSALNKTNLQLLNAEIVRFLKPYVQASFSIPVKSSHSQFISWLFSRAEVNSLKYEGDNVRVVFESVPWFADKVRERVIEFGGTFEKA
jgi:GTP-binding protein HflX